MRDFHRPVRESARALRQLLLTTATLIFAQACNRQDQLPTDPTISVPIAPQAAIVSADVTELPFTPVAINESGQVAGTVQQPGVTRAVRWTSGGGVQDLGTLGGTSSSAYAINEAGQVVGTSTTASGASHAFLWTPGQGMQDLGTLGSSSSTARGINDNGHVVGESYLPNVGQQPERHAFLWTPGQGMLDLGALPGLGSSIAYDINNAGQVVGRSFPSSPIITDPEVVSRAFLWTPTQGMQDLGTLGGSGSIAYAINEGGQVVGRAWTAAATYHAFLWTASQGMRDLSTLALGSGNSVAYGINDLGQVVGESNAFPASGGLAIRGFLWSEADRMEDLWPTMQIFTARDINNQWQVVGDKRVATLQLEPGSRPPVPTVGGPYTGTEGSAVSLALSATDPDGDLLTYNWDLGDGSAQSGNFSSPFSPSTTHVYADDGTYDIALTLRDTKGNVVTATTTATIANVAPTIPTGGLTGPTEPIQLSAGGAVAPITLTFSDPAGANDTYSAQIECGNGTTVSPTAITSPYAGTCSYTSAGVYTVRATVADEDGGTSAPVFFRYVIVYDPAGPFTTGSGFFAAPGQGKGKAHFTFNVKYIPGRPAAPNGTAKFWIPGAPVDFAATVIEALIASGDRVQFWGTGTLNGAAARVRVTAVDSPLTGGGGADAVRIELWRAGSLVFDTQPGDPQDAPVTTVIHGGNVEIHENARRH